MATFTVTNTADSGAGSLRQAIQGSNASVGVLDTINFSIGAGTRTITPTAANGALPNITDPLIIDAMAPAAFPTQVIELNGVNTPAGSNGLKITAGGSTVRGLTINRFPANGIELSTRGNNVIEGCRVGTDVGGTIDLGNGGDGMALNASSGNRVGGTSAARRNVISGNTSDGIEVSAGSNGNTIEGNYIGLQAGGAAALPNSATGVRIDASAGNTVGGAAAGARNVISGNVGDGVRVFGAAAQNNLVQGNYIGTNAAGTAAVRNGSGSGGGNGVTILSASNNTVGSASVAAAGNVISGNEDNGVEISGGAAGAASNNLVQGNFIGTNAAGTSAVPNLNDGVMISGPPLLTPGAGPASENVIGGPGAARNVISGNADDGIEINGPAATGNSVRGNFIGTDVSGTAALGNTSDGVEIEGAVSNTIGGPAASAEARNVISANASDGVEIWSGPAGGTGTPANNAVLGNYIGTAANGTAPLGNAKFGVNLAAGSNRVGGDDASAGNVIAFNGAGGEQGAGVFIDATAGRSAVRFNSVFSNAPGTLGSGLGIDLAPLGVTPNDAGDGDSGANNLQNYPDLAYARVFAAGGTVSVHGTLSSAPGGSFVLDFYWSPAGAADPSGFGEGRTYLGAAPVTTDAAGRAAFDATFAAAVPAGAVVSATATSAGGAGDTSEFSRTVTASEGPAVTSAAYLYQTSPHSVTFTFNRDVGGSLNREDLSVQNLTTGGSFVPASVAYNAANNTATFTLGGPLPDGNYRAVLSGAGVTSPDLTALPQDYVLDFFVLAGDVNRDRAVNGTDFALLAGSFGRTGMTYGQGDLNGDGAVNGSDFAILAGNFGKVVPAPAPPAAAAASVAKSSDLDRGPLSTAEVTRRTPVRHAVVRRRTPRSRLQ